VEKVQEFVGGILKKFCGWRDVVYAPLGALYTTHKSILGASSSRMDVRVA